MRDFVFIINNEEFMFFLLYLLQKNNSVIWKICQNGRIWQIYRKIHVKVNIEKN